MLGNTYGFKKGVPLSDDLKKKIGDGLRGEKNPNFGKHLPDLVKRKISETLKGTHLSEECKKKLGINSKGRVWYNNGTEEKLFRVVPNESWVKGRLHKIE